MSARYDRVGADRRRRTGVEADIVGAGIGVIALSIDTARNWRRTAAIVAVIALVGRDITEQDAGRTGQPGGIVAWISAAERRWRTDRNRGAGKTAVVLAVRSGPARTGNGG